LKTHASKHLGQITEIPKAINVEVDARDLPLNRTWDVGTSVSTEQKCWITKKFYSVGNIAEMWHLVNNSVGDKHFDIFNPNQKELWFFQEGCVPEWKHVKEVTRCKDLFEIIIDKPTKDTMIAIILDVLGESLPHSENVVGFRIKAHKIGGQIRTWVTNKTNLDAIMQRLETDLRVKCKSMNLQKFC
jgi:hypothetical protein